MGQFPLQGRSLVLVRGPQYPLMVLALTSRPHRLSVRFLSLAPVVFAHSAFNATYVTTNFPNPNYRSQCRLLLLIQIRDNVELSRGEVGSTDRPPQAQNATIQLGQGPTIYRPPTYRATVSSFVLSSNSLVDRPLHWMPSLTFPFIPTNPILLPLRYLYKKNYRR